MTNGQKRTKADSNATEMVVYQEINAQQATAITLLLAGKTQTEAAEIVGVRRQTVSDWTRRNPQFIAAYNAACAELRQARTMRVQQMADKALGVIDALLDSPNEAMRLKAAAAALAATPGHALPSGPTDPDEVEYQQQRAELHRQQQRTTDAMLDAMSMF